MIAECLKIDEQTAASKLEKAAASLGKAPEASFDFSSVRRIDSRTLGVLEDLVRAAEQKSVTIVLHGVNVDLYKALKLARLANRVSFVN